MVSWVLDTNVIAKWFLEKEGSDRAEKFLNALTEGSGRVLVPSSVFYELANVFWVRRRDAQDQEKATRLWAEVEELPLEVTDWSELLSAYSDDSDHPFRGKATTWLREAMLGPPRVRSGRLAPRSRVILPQI